MIELGSKMGLWVVSALALVQQNTVLTVEASSSSHARHLAKEQLEANGGKLIETSTIEEVDEAPLPALTKIFFINADQGDGSSSTDFFDSQECIDFVRDTDNGFEEYWDGDGGSWGSFSVPEGTEVTGITINNLAYLKAELAERTGEEPEDEAEQDVGGSLEDVPEGVLAE